MDRIARWVQPASDQVFLEIGAGAGALSVRLAPKCATLLAVEIDEDCIPVLREALAPFESASIVFEDILRLDLTELAGIYLKPGQKLRIAGNLPYNISTVIISAMLHSLLPIQDMFFMVQLEVAERILARPGTREYGYLSVECQHYAEARMGFKVSSACFVPRPKVSSAMISLHPKPRKFDAAWNESFEELCKGCFAYRRKTILNSLGRHPQFGTIAEALLSKAGIEATRRAEELSVQEYENLAETYRSAFF